MEVDEDVDIGCTTPMTNDDFWESQHPTHLCSHHSKKFLSPQLQLKFKWALKKFMPPLPFLKRFQPLVLMNMLLKKWRPRLLLKQKLKFLSLRP